MRDDVGAARDHRAVELTALGEARSEEVGGPEMSWISAVAQWALAERRRAVRA